MFHQSLYSMNDRPWDIIQQLLPMTGVGSRTLRTLVVSGLTYQKA